MQAFEKMKRNKKRHQELFRGLNLRNSLPRSKLISAYDDTFVSDAFKKLLDNRILYLPILSKKSGELSNIVTLKELICYILSTLSQEELLKLNHNQLANNETLTKAPLQQLQVYIAQEPVLEAPISTNLLDVARVMLSRNASKVILFDSDNIPQAVVTEKTIIKLIVDQLDLFPRASQTVKSSEIGKRDIYCVSSFDSAYHAFQQMISKRLPCVCVVHGGRLKGMLSLTDIKIVGYSMSWFQMLAEKTVTYLQMLGNCDLEDPLCCYESDTLGSIAYTFALSQTYQIPLVDSNKKPIGLITVKDIIRELLLITAEESR